MLRRIPSEFIKKVKNRDKLPRIIKNQNCGPIPSDVNGSYTGTARNGSTPEQDADDL